MCLSPEQQQNIQQYRPDLLVLANSGVVSVIGMDQLTDILKRFDVSVFYGPSDGEYESQIRLHCEATSGACYWLDIFCIDALNKCDDKRKKWVDDFVEREKAKIGGVFPIGTSSGYITCASHYLAPIIYENIENENQIAMIMCLTDEPFKFEEGSLTTSSLELAMITEQLKTFGDKLKVFLLVGLLRK